MKSTISQKSIISGLAILFGLLFFSTFSLAAELNDIRRAVKARGARWIAGETSVSQLPLEYRKWRAALIRPEVSSEERMIEAGSAPAGSFDWTTQHYVTPVRDQGNCGDCWAFGTTAALESYTLIVNQTPLPANGDENFSEQILVSCSGKGSCNGGSIGGASTFIRDTGLPSESCYPYTATNGNCANACTNWQNGAHKIGSWAYVATTSPTVDAIKNALYSYGPLVSSMSVTQTFSIIQGASIHILRVVWRADMRFNCRI